MREGKETNKLFFCRQKNVSENFEKLVGTFLASLSSSDCV